MVYFYSKMSDTVIKTRVPPANVAYMVIKVSLIDLVQCTSV